MTNFTEYNASGNMVGTRFGVEWAGGNFSEIKSHIESYGGEVKIGDNGVVLHTISGVDQGLNQTTGSSIVRPSIGDIFSQCLGQPLISSGFVLFT